MDSMTIIAAIAAGQKLLVSIAGVWREFDVSGVSKEDLLATLEQSKSGNWPDFGFESSAPDAAPDENP